MNVTKPADEGKSLEEIVQAVQFPLQCWQRITIGQILEHLKQRFIYMHSLGMHMHLCRCNDSHVLDSVLSNKRVAQPNLFGWHRFSMQAHVQLTNDIFEGQKGV